MTIAIKLFEDYMPRKTMQPPSLFASKPWGFSQVAISDPGVIINISGQVAWDADGKVNANGLEGQLRQALNQAIAAVEYAGGTSADIQIVRLFIKDFKSGADAGLISQVLHEVFGSDNPPASTWIGVQALAQPEYLIEVEVMAVVSA